MSQLAQMLSDEEVPREPGYGDEQPPPAPGRGLGRRAGRGGGVVMKSGVILRGSMSLNQVAEAVALSHDELCRKLKIPFSTPRDLILRDIMQRYDYTMSQIASMLEQP